CEDKSQRENFISFVDYALDHSTFSNFTHLPKYESQLEFVDDALLLPISRWKCLSTLKLKDMKLYDEEIVNILSGCHVLEILEFFEFYGLHHLETNCSNLKRLKFEDYLSYDDDSDDLSLNIFAPHIQHLEISEDMYDLWCRLIARGTFSGIFSASATCHPEEHKVIRTLI
ncbi:hypothetical protein H5410_023770, partial [Solanum commersonii]